MGQLRYSDTTVLEIDDVPLVHFQIVAFRKLRLQESFMLLWLDEVTGRRTTLWIHPHSSLAFSYANPQPPQVDPTQIRSLQEHVDATGLLRMPLDPAQPRKTLPGRTSPVTPG